MRINPDFLEEDDSEYDPEDNLKTVNSIEELPADAKERLDLHRTKFLSMLETNDQFSLMGFQALQIENLQHGLLALQKCIIELAVAIDKLRPRDD